MEMIKLVASDLDGTLLLHKAQSLPEEIFSLIRQLEELGIMFVAASGRQYPNMTKLFAPVASEISYISENGALAVDHGEVLYQDSFDRKLAGEIISAILEKKDAEFTCSAKDYHYLMPKTKRFHDHMLYEVKNECRFVNSMEEMTAPIMKELAKEYAGKIVIYKVNVDKEKELAALFNATSIPLFVFIPMQGEPQLFRGAADKATYKKAIDEFLLKK